LSIYGATKLQGEDEIRRSECRHLIFRTSWVYATHGQNFAKTMLRLACERDHLWEYRKVRYKGLEKNAAQLFTLFALADFYKVRHQLTT
jgi:dTDP-4-dehydrorhamnose reductase